MIDCTYIELNGLILYPSVDYVARLDGIMDFQKDVSESELFYDGSFYGSSKVTSRDLTLSVIIKHQFNVNENKAEKQLNFILKEENIKLRFKLENDDNFYVNPNKAEYVKKTEECLPELESLWYM